MEHEDFTQPEPSDRKGSGLSDSEIAGQLPSSPEVQRRLDEVVASRLRGDPIVPLDPEWGQRRMEELRRQIDERDNPGSQSLG